MYVSIFGSFVFQFDLPQDKSIAPLLLPSSYPKDKRKTPPK